MKTRDLIIIVVLILLLLNGGLYFATNKTSSNKAEEIEGTLISLINSGRSLTCTALNNINNSTVVGKVNVANGKARLDYQSTSNTLKMTGHIIIDDQYGYLWSEKAPNQGVRIALAPILTPAVKIIKHSSTSLYISHAVRGAQTFQTSPYRRMKNSKQLNFNNDAFRSSGQGRIWPSCRLGTKTYDKENDEHRNDG